MRAHSYSPISVFAVEKKNNGRNGPVPKKTLTSKVSDQFVNVHPQSLVRGFAVEKLSKIWARVQEEI